MKDKRSVRSRRTAGGRWRSAAAILAAVLMVLSMPLGLQTVHAVDLDQDCSLNIDPGSVVPAESFDQEFADTSLVIDLYRVADAVPVEGYDTYDWTMNQPFSSLTIDKEIDSAGWKALAQQAADIVLGKAPEGETEWDPSAAASAIDASLKSTGNKVTNQGGQLRAEISGLKAGLYLLIAHSVDQEGAGDPAKYAVAATDETGASAGTATIANSHTYKYTFAPELVSLPTKEANETGVISTGNPGDWIYDAYVTLKPSQDVRLGNLEITKTLETYAQREKTSGENPRTIKDPATFIFEVTAYEKKEADTVVFHDYVSLVFDAYGSRTAVVKDLPVDSYVVVKEAYSGRVYTTDTEKSTTIRADQSVGVEFVNTFDDKEPGGGSVTNHFSYTEKEGWNLKQVTDDTDDSIANPHNTFGSK